MEQTPGAYFYCNSPSPATLSSLCYVVLDVVPLSYTVIVWSVRVQALKEGGCHAVHQNKDIVLRTLQIFSQSGSIAPLSVVLKLGSKVKGGQGV